MTEFRSKSGGCEFIYRRLDDQKNTYEHGNYSIPTSVKVRQDQENSPEVDTTVRFRTHYARDGKAKLISVMLGRNSRVEFTNEGGQGHKHARDYIEKHTVLSDGVVTYKEHDPKKHRIYSEQDNETETGGTDDSAAAGSPSVDQTAADGSADKTESDV